MMIGGEVLDLEAESREPQGQRSLTKLRVILILTNFIYWLKPPVYFREFFRRGRTSRTIISLTIP